MSIIGTAIPIGNSFVEFLTILKYKVYPNRGIICLILYSGLFLTVDQIGAQPLPCGATPKMTSYCEDACIICDINGFKGRHNSSIPGRLPQGFCTTTVHNAQWIGFIAGSTNLTIALTVSNCVSNGGLEMTVYEGRNCSNFKQVFNCNGEVSPGSTVEFKNTEPLIIGQYYFLTMDGNGGDNCDWLLTVKAGTTLVSPLENSGQISSPDRVCPDTPIDFAVARPIGATEFFWDINGVTQPLNNDSVKLMFPADGTYTVCVQSANVCNLAPKTCKQIVAKTIPEITRKDVLCTGQCLTLNGIDYCESGLYDIFYKLENGCDSIVHLDLKVFDIFTKKANVNICIHDTLKLGNQTFTKSGTYEVHLPAILHCDSIIYLSLNVIDCVIEGEAVSTDAKCYNSSDGMSTFTTERGTPPFTYVVKNLEGQHVSSGNIHSLHFIDTVYNLPKDLYFIEISDAFGNKGILLFEVEHPSALETEILLSDFSGYNIDCFGSNNGQIEATAHGGSPPYFYTWREQSSTTNTLDKLTAGYQFLQIGDNNGCKLDTAVFLTQPEMITPEIRFIASTCTDDYSGKIEVQRMYGGIGPFEFSIDGKSYTREIIFSELEIGLHSIKIKDANRCELEVTDTIFPAQIPMISLADRIILDLGDEVLLDASINDISIENIEWKPLENIICVSCLQTSVLPLKSGFRNIFVTSIDNCTRSDSVFLEVNVKKKVFAPNVFYGNDASTNFELVAGSDVNDILELHIFDRWGNLAFTSNSEPVWDGKINGNIGAEGVYTWVAKVELINSETHTIVGSVLLLKNK